jgi:predicted ester cyclase
MDTGRALAHRMHEAFNTNDFAAMTDVFAADFHSHPMGTTGIEHIRTAWQAMRTRYPDLRTRIEDVVVEGDRVAMRSTVHGGLDGVIMEIFRVADGRIAELWGVSTLPLLD